MNNSGTMIDLGSKADKLVRIGAGNMIPPTLDNQSLNNPTVHENHNNSNNTFLNPFLNNDIIDANHFKLTEIAEHISNRDGIPYIDPIDGPFPIGPFGPFFPTGPQGPTGPTGPTGPFGITPEISGPIEHPFDPTPSCPAPEMPLKYVKVANISSR